LLVAACSTVQEAPVNSVETKRVLVMEGTQAHLGAALSIAAGNIWEDEYLDERGTLQRGMTATLWLAFGSDGRPRVVKIHPGQRVEAPGHLLQVVEIAGGQRGSVLLDVTAR
jgi:hypothetical protein